MANTATLVDAALLTLRSIANGRDTVDENCHCSG